MGFRVRKRNYNFESFFNIYQGHQGEIVSLNFSAEGDKIITGSFDCTARVIFIEIQIWDTNTG